MIKSRASKTYFILAIELLVRNVCRQVGVEESAEGQPIAPAAAEVGNVDVLWEETTKTITERC